MASSNTKDSTAKSLANTLSNVSKIAKSYGINTAKADAMVAQTKAEGSKSFKGSSYEKDYKAGKYGVITSEKIQPTTPITLPQEPKQDGMFGVLEMNNAAVTPPPTTQTNTTEGHFQNLVQEYLGANAQAYSEVPSSVDRLKDSRKLYAPQEKLVNSLQNQLNAITTSRDKEMLKLEGQGRGQTEGFIGGEQARISREAAIRAMPVQSQLAAAQQDLDSARSYAAQYFQSVTQDDIARYNYQKDVNSTIFGYLNSAGQRALEAKQKEEDRAFEVLQSNRKDLKSLSLQAIEYGQPALAGEFMRLDPNSPTYDSDVADAMSRMRKPVSPSADVDQLYSGLSSATATAVRAKVGKFSTEPLVQNFATIQEGFNFAQSLSDTTTNPADDQALIYALAKTLDPGSVVREGEYATAQKYAQSWVKAFGTGVEQAIAGTGFLSQEARKNIKNTIESRYNASKTSYQNLYNNYSSSINTLTGRNDGSNFLVDYATPVPEPMQGPVNPRDELNKILETPDNPPKEEKGFFKSFLSVFGL